jgi:hypothetical protein
MLSAQEDARGHLRQNLAFKLIICKKPIVYTKKKKKAGAGERIP